MKQTARWMWGDLQRTFLKDPFSQITKVDAVYVPSYGLARGGKRLTYASQLSMLYAAYYFTALRARYLILPTPFHKALAAEERRLKKKFLRDTVPNTAQIFLGGYTQSIEETGLFLYEVEKSDLKSVCVIGANAHLPRVLWQIYAQNKKLSVKAVGFDTILEPYESTSWWKGYTNHRFLWMPWNALGYLVTPHLIKRAREE